MSLPGRLAYHLFFRPIAAVRYSLRHGGPFRQWVNARGEQAMREAARRLPSLPERANPALTVHLLTGVRYVHQTAFCLHSLGRACRQTLRVEIYDDGSLGDGSRDQLRRLCPHLQIHDHGELQARLDDFLPIARFPVLRERWLNYPHIRKLIDVHLGRSGWRLVLDSDLLFWRNPDFLLEWSAAPVRPLHAIDHCESYGYPRPLLEKVAGTALPPLVNVGLCGLQSDAIDWEFLESAAASLIAAKRTSYYLEQALVAMLVARTGRAAVAPARDYVTLPCPAEIVRPTAVMHHYVDTARGAYLRHAWRAFS